MLRCQCDCKIKFTSWKLPLAHQNRVAYLPSQISVRGDETLAKHLLRNFFNIAGTASESDKPMRTGRGEKLVVKKMPINFCFSYLIAVWIPPRKQFVKCPVSRPSAKTWAFTTKFLVRRSRATLSASLGVAAMPKRGVLILCWFRSFIATCSWRLSLRTIAAFTAKLWILDNIVDISHSL